MRLVVISRYNGSADSGIIEDDVSREQSWLFSFWQVTDRLENPCISTFLALKPSIWQVAIKLKSPLASPATTCYNERMKPLRGIETTDPFHPFGGLHLRVAGYGTPLRGIETL